MGSTRGAGIALAGLVIAAPVTAAAHQVGLSQGRYRVAADGAEVGVTLIFARGEIRSLAAEVDQDRDGELSEVELMVGAGVLEEALAEGIAVAIDDRDCAQSFAGASLAEEDGLEIRLRFACPLVGVADTDADGEEARPGELRIDLPALLELGGAHRHIARVLSPGSDKVRAERVLHRLKRRARVPLSEPPPVAGPPTEAASTRARADAGRSPAPTDAPGAPTSPSVPEDAVVDRDRAAYFTLGVEHILVGVDHLVFLLGLVIVGGRTRNWVAMITAFTLGHSLSLGLAALGLLAPSPALVEPLIAASIVYVGLENLLTRDLRALRRRWRITLPFGFVHGFGFAGALIEIGLPPGEEAVVLALFNLGVEVGQLAALAVIALVLAGVAAIPGLRDRPWQRVVSVGIVLAGLVWLCARVIELVV
jgi:hydrogenase/urease accessory protein HupE